MSGSAARRTRRDIRRALGPEALDFVGQHGHAIAQHADQIAILQHTVASCVSDIALLQAQFVAAGFGTTAAQAEAATRHAAMDRRSLHVTYDKLWDRVEQFHLFRRQRWYQRWRWIFWGR